MSIGDALAENRIALVIGNSSYTSVTALPNPANDAKAMAKFLSSAGFQVLQAPNLTQGDMRKTIGNFASMVAEKGPDTVALVFYAGHGLQVDGENFLVPVDAQIEREADVPLQAMRLADVMNALGSVPSKTIITILDACRNNPFSAINKTTGRGLAIVDSPKGSLVSYSTAPGTEALDGDRENSPFTSALLKIGQEPGLPIEQVLKRVRLDVSNATDRQQFPWESSSLTSEFSFFPTGDGQEQSKAASTGQPGTTGKSETRSVDAWQKELKSKSAREAYDIVVREDKVEAYQAYLALYSSQPAAPAVRSLLDRRQVAIAWYNAVTVNTVASYQAFLASYGSSDFAQTADRLIERARSRSISDATAAFASVGPTCPCSQPTTPTLRQKRTDVSPTQNTGSGASSTSTTTGTSVAIVDPGPTTVITNPVTPVIIPINPKPPRGRDPESSGNDKPKGGSNNDKPKPTGSGSSHDTPVITRGKTNDNPVAKINSSTGINTVRSLKVTNASPISGASPMAGAMGAKAFSMGPKPMGMGMGMPRMGFGRH
jgi:uncharacterized caspase-like protein